MAYYWLKTFHIVGVVVWFAGLFYLVRLLVYHREASARPAAERAVLEAQYSIMESRLLHIITTPGMLVTLVTAAGLLYVLPEYLRQGWMQAKLACVACLVAYHAVCARLVRAAQRGACAWSPQRLRAWNELPTLLLVAVVMLVVFKQAFPTEASAWLMFGLVVSMVAAIQLYAKRRRRLEGRAG
ncbi:MAG: protoporphyrinogen oxidase HemJ [Deltaproteobacteria bacterium]|nr:protoporphyrinogen oxidase HemJ [Deltaproteobacteria bacterium]